MTNFALYTAISQRTNQLSRLLDAKALDKEAFKIAKEWRLFRHRKPSATLADFARLRDRELPDEFDEQWDTPAYTHALYFLLRAGAQPEVTSAALRKAHARAVSRKRRNAFLDRIVAGARR